MRSPTPSDAWQRIARLGVSLLGATLGVALWLGLLYWLGDDPERPRIQLEAESLQLTAGEGSQTDQGLAISRPGANGLILVQGGIQPLRARDYQVLRWRIQGLEEAHELRLVWASPASVRRPFDRVLTPAERRAGMIRLDADPRWEGMIIALGLAIVTPPGSSDGPWVIQSLSILPTRPRPSELMHLIWSDWLSDQGWVGRSINFTDSAAGQGRVRPLWPIAVWCGLAILLSLLLAIPWRGNHSWWPYLLILWLGWLALDIRWQILLSGRLDHIRSLYAGLAGEERHRVSLDQPFWPIVQSLRAKLGPQPQRLLILADPADYVANRLRYHLLPHNVRLVPELADTTGLRVGDALLLLSPVARGSYDPARAELRGSQRRVRVEQQLDLGGFGVLLQVTEVD